MWHCTPAPHREARPRRPAGTTTVAVATGGGTVRAGRMPARFSGSEESFAGLVVDGRWIHFGALSQPVAGAAASVDSGAELLRRGRLGRPATARVLYGPSGLITPRLLPRSVIGGADYILVEVAGQVWLAAVPTGEDAGARRFVSWITSVSEHYRYR